ncbi:hypothetical protein G6652_02030 [Polynucleobacter paneuropaeus]|jgi:hypothetical protein|nr:hypothetical protein [Polynucleobacter paneuropaeus]MBT8616011.1 hypothetical protein [Polynucleobacter paneuropaeus]MBT8617892.1 hypothetical protein [Polynucleobacter paneuropaeus]MBT8619773.1 hypothetical protein [Polynucleobacter paneuropaeus]MBT8625308.1 hypothetical protein [Polynucleobacter paneuropaeus]
MNTAPLQNKSSVFKVKNLDLTTAKEVKSLADATQGECSVLDLSSFLDADLSAIEYLGQYPYDFVTLGMEKLSRDLAGLLGKWVGEPYLIFEQLTTLDQECAKALCQSTINLDLGSVNSLSINTIKELVKLQGNLGLFFENISLEMANILKDHQYGLSLILRNEPSYEVATKLGEYQGHELFFYRMPTKPSAVFLDALSLSQTKTVSYDQVAFPFFSIELRNKD